MIEVNGLCPCGHEVRGGECIVREPDGTEHRFGPMGAHCRCHGLPLSLFE